MFLSEEGRDRIIEHFFTGWPLALDDEPFMIRLFALIELEIRRAVCEKNARGTQSE